MKRDLSVRTINNRNSMIDLFKFLFSILIVALHTDPFLDINPYIHYFYSETLSRLAVPFFAAVSGYYMATANSYRIKRHIWAFSKIYLFWSIVYLIFDIAYLKAPNVLSFNYLANVMVINSRAPIWYILAIVIVLIIHLIIICKQKKGVDRTWILILIVFGMLGAMRYGYGKLFQRLFLLDLGILNGTLFLVLPFYALGHVLYSCSCPDYGAKKTSIYLILLLCLFFAEVLFVTYFDFKENITVLISIFPLTTCCLLFCQQPFNLSERTKVLFIVLGALSQYVYYTHFLVMYFFSTYPYTLKYILTLVVSIMISFVIILVKKRLEKRMRKVRI